MTIKTIKLPIGTLAVVSLSLATELWYTSKYRDGTPYREYQLINFAWCELGDASEPVPTRGFNLTVLFASLTIGWVK